MLTTALVSFLFPILACAQDYGAPAPGPPSASSSSAAAAATAPPSTANQININVAFNEQFVFNPANVSAPVGATVSFYFPNNGVTHSVTQSSFAAPCTYLAANTTANTTGGFDSGLVENVVFTINITDTQPIWFHCKQVTHCGMGMVGSINAPATGNTFDSFHTAALAIGSNEVTEKDNGPVLGGVHATAVGTPAAAAAATSPAAGGTTSGANSVVASGALALVAAGVAFVMA